MQRLRLRPSNSPDRVVSGELGRHLTTAMAKERTVPRLNMPPRGWRSHGLLPALSCRYLSRRGGHGQIKARTPLSWPGCHCLPSNKLIPLWAHLGSEGGMISKSTIWLMVLGHWSRSRPPRTWDSLNSRLIPTKPAYASPLDGVCMLPILCRLQPQCELHSVSTSPSIDSLSGRVLCARQGRTRHSRHPITRISPRIPAFDIE